ncbi:MAG: RsmE family RNA methyltransferase [Spirochaetaceae bacterium]|nr:RsmE family RNA methyltransferase [Spirochaetaceae bacterium]
MKQLIVSATYKGAAEICLTGKQYTYLVRVLRKRRGETLTVTFCDGFQCECLITHIDTGAKKLFLKPQSPVECGRDTKAPLLVSAAPTVKLILLQWLLKGAKLDTVVRQATELGVHAVFLVSGEFSVVQAVSNAKESRYMRIVTEARQQSGSPIATMVFPSMRLEHVLEQVDTMIEKLKVGEPDAKQGAVERIVFSERSETTESLHERLCSAPGIVVLAVGPEGGMSEPEYALLARAGFKTCHLRTNILRAETASLYALASVQTITEENTWQLKEYS